MRLEQVLLMVGVIGIAAWRVYRMWKAMAYHYRRYRYHKDRKKETAAEKFRF